MRCASFKPRLRCFGSLYRFTTHARSCRTWSVAAARPDRKSTRLNSSHTDIYALSLHDALPIYALRVVQTKVALFRIVVPIHDARQILSHVVGCSRQARSEEHTSELQSH